MIDKSVFIKVLMEKVKKLPVGHYLDIRSYKRNRTVLVIKENYDLFLVTPLPIKIWRIMS